MDELWFLLVIAVSVVSGVMDSKKKKAARRAAAEAEATVLRKARESKERAEFEAEMHKESSADEAEPFVIRKATTSSAETRRAEAVADYAVPESEGLSEVEAAMKHIAERSSSLRDKAPNVKVRPETGAEESVAENFDLRKAVIYSEIMKPKFDNI